MERYQALIRKIELDYKDKGYKFIRSVGTHLYGSTPHKGKDTWHNEVFRPLKEDEIETLQAQVGMTIPAALRELYLVADGLRLFSDELAVYGFRPQMGRSGDNVWQPYSLVEPNTLERPEDASADELFVGGYSFDGSLVKLNIKTGAVAATRPRSAKEFAHWPNLAFFLESEYSRLKGHFNERLELIDQVRSTLPD